MIPFSDRIKLTPSQRKEVETYLGTTGIINEFSILKLVRKMKQIELKLEERKYE